MKHQVVKNLLSNIVNFIIGIIYGLIIPPFLIHRIGEGAFGIVQITTGIMMYIGIIAGSINEAISRSFTIKYQQGDKKAVSQIFNTSLVFYAAIFVVSLPIILVISFNSHNIFNIPTESIEASHYLFLFTLVGFFFTLITSVFLVPAFATNRIDLFQKANILRNILKVILILASIELINPSIFWVGVSNLLAVLISFSLSIHICWKLLPDVTIGLRYFKKSLVKELLSFGGWTIVNQLGTLIFLYIDIILINILVGDLSSGQYGALMQWNSVLRNMAGILGRLFAPLFLIYFGRHEIKKLLETLGHGLKLQGLVLAIPVGLIFVYAEELLNLWLGEKYGELHVLLRVMVFHLGVNYMFVLLTSVTLTFNKIKTLGIYTLIFSLAHIILGVILIEYFGMGIYGPAISGAVLLGIKNFVFFPIFISSFTGLKKKYIYERILYVFLIQLVIFFIGNVVKRIIPISDWLDLIYNGLIILSIVVPIIWFLLIRKSEKMMLVNYLKKGA